MTDPYDRADWEDGRAEHHLIVEEGMARRALPLWEFEGWHDDKLQVGIPALGAIRLSPHQAVMFANAILSEVEMRTRR